MQGHKNVYLTPKSWTLNIVHRKLLFDLCGRQGQMSSTLYFDIFSRLFLSGYISSIFYERWMISTHLILDINQMILHVENDC